MAALFHPPGGIIRHDAVVWAYARGVDQGGGHVHQRTEVQAMSNGCERQSLRRPGHRRPPAGADSPHGLVVNATAGCSTPISEMAGVNLPISMVSAPGRRHRTREGLLDRSSSQRRCTSTSRSRTAGGARPRGEVDRYSNYSLRGSLDFTEGAATCWSYSRLSNVQLLRQWAGLCDMTPDYSPIMGVTPVDGFLYDVGWGTYGFKAGPVSGETMAECIATGSTPKLIAPFSLQRFSAGHLVGEKGVASVGH